MDPRTLLLAVALLSVVGRQTSILFDTPFAYYGRWVAVAALAAWGALSAVRANRPILLPAGWMALFYAWVLWLAIVALPQQVVRFDSLLADVLAPLGLMVAGIALGARSVRATEGLKALNTAFLLVSATLAALSGLAIATSQAGSLYLDGRWIGVFTKPQSLSWVASNLLACAVVYLAWSGPDQRHRPSRTLLLVTVLLASGVILMTGVRGTIVSTVVAYFLTVPMGHRGSKRLAMTLVSLAVVLAAAIFVLEYSPQTLRIATRYGEGIDWNAISSGRYSLATSSLDQIAENPAILVFGTGDRDPLYLEHLGDYVDGGWHDPFARIQSSGLLGYVLFHAIQLTPIVLCFRMRRGVSTDGSDRALMSLTLFLMARMFVSSLGDSSLIIGHLDYAFFWLAYGALFAVRDQQMARTLGERGAASG